MRITPTFGGLLVDYHLDALDASEQTIYAIDADFRLCFVNRGWDRFAERNHGSDMLEAWPLGRRICDGMDSVLWTHQHQLLQQAMSQAAVVTHAYQCPTPDLARTYTMTVYPLSTCGWLLVHAESYQGPIPDVRHAFDPKVYLDEHGFAHQCAHCRKIRRGVGETWDWVPQLVEAPHPHTSHGLCPACLGFYYPSA